MPFTKNDISKVDNHRSLLLSCLLCYLILLTTGCASREGATYQNITSRFNIMYNAERLLADYLNTEDVFVPDDYNTLLPVFKKLKADADTKLLDSVILKANTIISKKTQSDYLDDAYFLVAEANFLKGNFYNAAEFYTYVYSNYPQKAEIAQLARINKARSLLALNNNDAANAILDSALNYGRPSETVHADLFALKTQLLIMQDKLEEVEQTLIQALSAKPSKLNRQRWRFLLAQLQERNNKRELALKNYKSLKKSFAPSELAFHADVKQLRINNELHGNEIDGIQLLQTFLNNDLYIDYKDRIYYMIGKAQEQRNELTDALISYKNSVKTSPSNSIQKGLAYSSLAEMYFGSGLYQRALSYYDSALAALPASHFQYADVGKRAETLSHLKDIFEKINFEETLQRIAELPEGERQQEVTELIRKRNNEEAEHLNSSILLERDERPGRTGSFYFDNSKALTQGATDFSEKWGNRILKDDWRYQISGAPTAASGTTSPLNNEASEPVAVPERRFEDYINNLPIGPDAIKASNERIAASLYEIGLFYLNKQQDEKRASATFEKLAGRFSETSYALPAYYRLYLIKRQTEPEVARRYENLILTRYPESDIANIIQQAASGTEDRTLSASDETYTRIYNLFANKQYKEVVRQVETARKDEVSESFSPQLDYLYAISMGYSQIPKAFEDSLQSFVFKHAQDSLVTPLVQQHLEHIRHNRESFSQRPVALVTNEIVRPDQNIAELSMGHTVPEIRRNKPVTPGTHGKHELPLATPTASITAPASSAPIPYYFVVNVLSATTNLSPSRFGIGQFNRSRYPGVSIKHQLKVVNRENQLIFVGPFQDEEEALSYEGRILPMIRQIMKIPAERYNTFVISEEGLGQLNTREQIQTHIEHTTKNIK